MGERGSVTDSVWSVVRFLSKVLDLAIFLRSGVTDVGFVCGAFEFYLCNKVGSPRRGHSCCIVWIFYGPSSNCIMQLIWMRFMLSLLK
jgi:hypothetical protein